MPADLHDRDNLPEPHELKRLLEGFRGLRNMKLENWKAALDQVVRYSNALPGLFADLSELERTRNRQVFLYKVFGRGGHYIKASQLLLHMESNPKELKLFSLDPLLRARALMAKLEGTSVPLKMGKYDILPARERPEEPDYPFQGMVEFQGLVVDIENLPGTYRGDYFMKFAYGELRDSPTAPDGDKLDIYLGPNPESEWVFVVHQHYPSSHPKKANLPDEDKVMLGWDDPTAAREAYLSQYDDPTFFGSMTMIPLHRFKKWVKSLDAEKQHAQPPVKWKPRLKKGDKHPDEKLAFSLWPKFKKKNLVPLLRKAPEGTQLRFSDELGGSVLMARSGNRWILLDPKSYSPLGKKELRDADVLHQVTRGPVRIQGPNFGPFRWSAVQ